MTNPSIWDPASDSVPAVRPQTFLVEETIYATEGQTDFTIQQFTYVPNTGTLRVYVNGVRVTGVRELTGSTFGLPIGASCKLGDKIFVEALLEEVSASQVTFARSFFTATEGQTFFAVENVPGKNIVILNGATLSFLHDYTSTSAGITVIEPCKAGDFVEVYVFSAIKVDDTVAASDLAGPLGASLVGIGNGRTQADKNAEWVSVKDFGATGDGITPDTSAVQTLFDEAASRSAKEVFFPDGTYLLTNPRNDADYTCAIVISGLRNCVVRGTKNTKFTLSPSGSATPGFGFFRLEQCENVTFEGFELDGSGLAVTTGSNRLLGIVAVNFDVNNPSNDLPTFNKQLEFKHLYIHDSGGGVQVARRSLTLADTPMTDGFSVHDCRMENLLGIDHGVAAPRTRNLHVFNNSFVNDIANVTIQDNMAVDASSGCEVAHIHNNYVYGFMFGMKCESTRTAGPLGNEVRASKRVTFENNRLEEIGDPTVFIVPGPFGGDTFGIKANGKDCLVIGNTVKPRTVNVTTGGLAFGIVVVNTHHEDSHVLVEGNTVYGCQYGILQNDSTSATNECSVDIRSNRCQDAAIYGIQVQANCTVENNRILRAGRSAVALQLPVENTFVRNNIAINCASTNNDVIPNTAVFYQEGTGAVGLFTFENNTIVDTRGAGAAEYGYYFRVGIGVTNPIVFSPGYCFGLKNAIGYDKYFSVVGASLPVENFTDVTPRTIYTTNTPQSTFPWDTMTWRVGDRAVIITPAIGLPKGWVCTVAGTPGTWVSEGNL